MAACIALLCIPFGPQALAQHLEPPASSAFHPNSLTACLVLLPAFLLLVAAGAWFAKRALSMRRAEAELRGVEEHFHRLLDFAPVGIFMHDGTRIVYANRRCAEFLGATSPTDIVGKPNLSFVHPDFHSRVDAYVAEHLQSGQSMLFDEQVFVRQDGRGIRVEVAASPVGFDGKRLVQVLFLDITARKAAEEELRKAEERYRTLFEQAIEGIYRSTIEGRFEEVNPPLAAMLGYGSPAELVAAVRDIDCELYVPTGRRADFLASFGQDDKACGFESQVRRKDGSVIWVLENTRAIRDAAGRVIRFEGSMVDITLRKQAEQRLKASLEEKEIMLREIHHRVKNNLQVVSAFLSLQGDSLADPTVRNAFREGQNRIRALAAIHESLYQSSDLRGIDLSVYIPRLAKHVFNSYVHGSGKVRLALDVAAVQVAIDTAIPCGLIVNELLSNALKHGFPDGRSGAVRVSLTGGNGRITLAVRDDGVGLPVTFDLRSRKTLGMQILGALVQQLGGALEYGAADGAAFSIAFSPKVGTPILN